MAMTGNHSPRHPSDELQSRRAAQLPVSSPWKQVVRGESGAAATSLPPPPMPQSPEGFPSVATPPIPADDSNFAVESSDNGGNTAKRHVWNKPSSNGTASDVSPVIDAVSWPALSESKSARAASMKSESSKGLLDGSSVPQLQGLGSTTFSSSLGQVNDDASANNMMPSHQKSIQHNSSNTSSNVGHHQQFATQVSLSATGTQNSSPKGHTQRSGLVSNDHPQQRNSFRNRNGGPNQRGDSTHHRNYGNRRDQEWNSHRNFSGRGIHMPPRGAPRFMRPPPPPNAAQFVHPPPMRPFGSHIGFHELAPPMVFVAAPPPPPDTLRGVPFIPPFPHHAMFVTSPDPQLYAMIVHQIDYYFSDDNLAKDTFLRKNMDDQGWVPVKLIAGFKKVMQLTDNIQLILDAVRTSSTVEVQGDKIRRRNDWRKWIIPPPVQFPTVTTSGVLSLDKLAEQVHNVDLETTKYGGAGGLVVLPDTSENRSSFEELNSPAKIFTRESTDQDGIQVSDQSISSRK